MDGNAQVTAAAPRRGMSMVEVIVAVVILGGSLLAMGAFVTNFTRQTRLTNSRTLAGQLVSQRLEQIKTWNNYYTLVSTYATTENAILPGYNRRTIMLKMGGVSPSKQDHILITVIVYGKAIRDTVKNTIAIPRF